MHRQPTYRYYILLWGRCRFPPPILTFLAGSDNILIKQNLTAHVNNPDASIHLIFKNTNIKINLICWSEETWAAAHLLVPFVRDPLDLNLFPTHDALQSKGQLLKSVNWRSASRRKGERGSAALLPLTSVQERSGRSHMSENARTCTFLCPNVAATPLIDGLRDD